MAPTALSTIFGAFALALLAAILFRRAHDNRNPQNLPLPPGPKGWPIIGNLLEMPRETPWIKFEEWSRIFGPIYTVSVMGQRSVVISDPVISKDLLESRAAMSSDRPDFEMVEIMTGGATLAFTRYGDLWRRLRRAAHVELNVKDAGRFQPIQMRESRMLLEALVETPEDLMLHIKRLTGSVVLGVVYQAKSAQTIEDPLLQKSFDVVAALTSVWNPGQNILDFFPALMKLMPSKLVKAKRLAKQFYDETSSLHFKMMNDVRKSEGARSDCMTWGFLEAQSEAGSALSDAEIAWLSGSIFGAGAETTSSTLHTFFMAMALNPDIMRKIQHQIDTVVGRDRLPTFEDRADLPWVSAVMKEVMRWRPILPLSLPHVTTEDIVYEGMFIPAGTALYGSVWSLNHDPAVFPDPEAFKPERFWDDVNKKELNPTGTMARGMYTFGTGRRVCVGMNLANATMFAVVSRVLWAFDIFPALDAEGKEIPIDTTHQTGFIDSRISVRPKNFACRLVPRVPADKLAQAIADAKEHEAKE
ncbi:cytochrome P450 [Mycena epipterygia]|nr:cytochrome P450 [Mycena epipterygia]